MNQAAKMPRLLHLHLDPEPEYKEQTNEIIEAASDLPECFSHVIATCPAWQDYHDVDGLLLHLLEDLRGDQIILARRLWQQGEADREAPLNAAHYAVAMERVQREAQRYALAGCALDGEAYSGSIGRWLSNELPEAHRVGIVKSCYAATKAVPPVDLIMPVGSIRPKSYTWLIKILGRANVCESTYYSTGESLPNINPPGPHKVDYWGTFTGYRSPAGLPVLSVAQTLALDWPRIRAHRYSDERGPMFDAVRGQMVYIDHKIENFARTVAAFRETAQ